MRVSRTPAPRRGTVPALGLAALALLSLALLSLALLSLALLSLALLSLAPAARAQTTINTLPDQSGEIGVFGVGNFATFGQTVTAPDTGVLQDFTFDVNNDGGAPILVDAEVYAYNTAANMALGPALYQSAPFTLAANSADTLSTADPNVAVTAGTEYALIFTSSGLQSGQPGSSSYFGVVPPGTYTGGGFIFMDNGNNHSQLASGAYDASLSSESLAFKADFGPPLGCAGVFRPGKPERRPAGPRPERTGHGGQKEEDEGVGT